MFLAEKNYDTKALLHKTVLVTGGGSGIGFEAARAFSYMGARVILAEIDAVKGIQAQMRINREFHHENADFFPTDLADPEQINRLYEYVKEKYTRLDVILNNAAFVPMGAVEKVPVSDWDLSYAVNLRAPVLLAQKFLPMMKKTGGIILFVPSAATVPYMSAYEIFKSAQAELCRTLSEEIPGNIITYAIAPGLVKTDTAVRSIETVAASMGVSVAEFYKMHEEYIFDAERAGAGFAVSVVNAAQYNGRIAMSWQVLAEAGLMDGNNTEKGRTLPPEAYAQLTALFTEIAAVFFDQYQSWQRKKIFEKGFILSDFKKQMGMPAEHFRRQLEALREQIEKGQWDDFLHSRELFGKLRQFYGHQAELLKNYEKNQAQLEKDTRLLNGWQDILQKLITVLPR